MATNAEKESKYPVLKCFAYGVQAGGPLADMAYALANTESAAPAEIAAGLRKLLEARDCFVRAASITGDLELEAR